TSSGSTRSAPPGPQPVTLTCSVLPFSTTRDRHASCPQLQEEEENEVNFPSRFSTIARVSLRGVHPHREAFGIALAVLAIVAYTIAFLIDEPLRRYTEAKLNGALKGYTARIGRLDFHPPALSHTPSA